MSKKVFRYFGGFIRSQQNWLNAMSEKGYRLKSTGRLVYEFEETDPNKYQYCVDFVAHKSNAEVNKYKDFLMELGYNVISKNININYSVGKIRFRPYGEGLGKIATSLGNYNKELLIVEKINDGKPFELYTTAEDRIALVKVRRNVYFSGLVLFSVVSLFQYVQRKEIVLSSLVFLLLSFISIIQTIVLNKQICRLKKQSAINE